ncbi:MAG: SpoIIIAH-like family protein [Clostridia bacterium]|nr:SpoIIIAH-like family protein [Clostridia bacterium]
MVLYPTGCDFCGECRNESTVAQETEKDYFAAARLRRRTAHDEAAETLNDIIKDADADPNAVKSASAKLEDLAETPVLEGDPENMITAKPDCDCLAILNGDQAEVIAPSVIKENKLNKIN